GWTVVSRRKNTRGCVLVAHGCVCDSYFFFFQAEDGIRDTREHPQEAALREDHSGIPHLQTYFRPLKQNVWKRPADGRLRCLPRSVFLRPNDCATTLAYLYTPARAVVPAKPTRTR